MKQIFTVIFAFICITTFSQTQKEVENGIFVTFPTAVKYQANTQATIYRKDQKLFVYVNGFEK